MNQKQNGGNMDRSEVVGIGYEFTEDEIRETLSWLDSILNHWELTLAEGE